MRTADRQSGRQLLGDRGDRAGRHRVTPTPGRRSRRGALLAGVGVTSLLIIALTATTASAQGGPGGGGFDPGKLSDGEQKAVKRPAISPKIVRINKIENGI